MREHELAPAAFLPRRGLDQHAIDGLQSRVRLLIGDFVGGSGVYVISGVVSLFSAVIGFILIALVAVYYIVERTPGAPEAESQPDK